VPWTAALVGTLALMGVFALFFAANPSGELWAALTPGDCPEYCEAHTRCEPAFLRASMHQPANARSSWAFVFVGLLALRTRPRALALLFSLSAIVLGIGSLLFHASITREMQWLDMVGTYAAVVALAAFGAARLGVRPAVALAAALAVDVLLAVFKWRIDAWIALPLLVAAAAAPIVLAVRAGRGSASAALVPLALLAVATALREADVRRAVCWPDSLLQGHALWHLLCAASLGTAFRFLATLAPGPSR
jgi:hypothetical protein